MNKDLDYSMTNEWCIRLNTRNPDGDAYDGVVLAYNRKYVAIREIKDFEPDGIIVIPKKWIKSIRNGRLEESYNAVIRHCNTVGRLDRLRWFHDHVSLEEIMGYLKSQETWPVVEVVTDNDTYVYIGEITAVSKDSFDIYCYDAESKWEKVYRLKYESVFKIEIESRYVRHFNDYMRAKRDGA